MVNFWWVLTLGHSVVKRIVVLKRVLGLILNTKFSLLVNWPRICHLKSQSTDYNFWGYLLHLLETFQLVSRKSLVHLAENDTWSLIPTWTLKVFQNNFNFKYQYQLLKLGHLPSATNSHSKTKYLIWQQLCFLFHFNLEEVSRMR